MGIVVDWDDAENTTLRFDFEDVWTCYEFRYAHELAQNLQASVPHKVVHIYNFTVSRYVPYGILNEGKRLLNRRLENSLDTYLIVGASPFMQSVGKVFLEKIGSYYGVRLLFIRTLEEARQEAQKLLASEDYLSQDEIEPHV